MATKKVQLTSDQDTLLRLWQEQSQVLYTAKEKERELRTKVVIELSQPEKLEGSETLDIGNDWKLKIQKVQNYSAVSDNSKVTALLQFIADEMLDTGLAQELGRWQFELSKSAYNKLLKYVAAGDESSGSKALADKLKILLSEAITIKPGSPQVELIPPENKE